MGTSALNMNNAEFNIFLNFRKDMDFKLFLSVFDGLSLFPLGIYMSLERPTGQSKVDTDYSDFSKPSNNCGFIPFVIETPVEVLKHWKK